MELSIVVPVYREGKNIPEFLRRLQPILAPLTGDYEIIFLPRPGQDVRQRRRLGRLAALAFHAGKA